MTQEEKEEMTKELQRKMAQNLQRNYTTVEQSKQLLEIGVPANSADCYYEDTYYKKLWDEPGCFRSPITIRQTIFETNVDFFDNPIYLPCWSVGRLEEIFDICSKNKFILDGWRPSHITNMYIHSITQVEYFVTWFTNCKQLLDFLKLGM